MLHIDSVDFPPSLSWQLHKPLVGNHRLRMNEQWKEIINWNLLFNWQFFKITWSEWTFLNSTCCALRVKPLQWCKLLAVYTNGFHFIPLFGLDDKTTCVSHTCRWFCNLGPSRRLSAELKIFWYILLFRWDSEEGGNKHRGVVREASLPGGSLSASRTALPEICAGDSSHVASSLNIHMCIKKTVLRVMHGQCPSVM